METKIIKIDKDGYFNKILNYPASILNEGGIVAFPTETVYGLGANALDSDAIMKIFEAKGRPADNPLIVHIASINELDKLVDDYSAITKMFISKFWPGPLTIIFKKKDIVPDIVTAGLDTVAVRMPGSSIARKLIELAEVPIAAPSANLSGAPSPTNVKHVIDDMSGKIECIIDGGDCSVGLESTVLDLTSEVPTVLRPGGITLEQLREVTPNVQLDAALEDKNMVPKSPGMKYVHYAPEADVFVLTSDIEGIEKKIKSEFPNKVVGVMGSDEFVTKFTDYYCISLGKKDNLDDIAANLFSTLRKFDEANIEIIIAESFEDEGLGHAIMNRLRKSAGFKVI